MLIDAMIMPLFSTLLKIMSHDLIVILFCKRRFFNAVSRFISVCFITALLYASSFVDISFAEFCFSSISVLNDDTAFFYGNNHTADNKRS